MPVSRTAPGDAADGGEVLEMRGSKTDAPRVATAQRRLALVVQRYGEGVDGGAEYHCRLIAERLNKYHRVEVLTSCARDYVSWRNELPAGPSLVNGVEVRRFKVKRPRDPERFGRLSQKIFREPHSEKDELRWLQEQGPLLPSLIRYLERKRQHYDYYFFFSYRYYHSYHGVRRLSNRSILVPTAEKDEVLSLQIFRRFFKLPRAVVYNSFEERAMIWEACGNQTVTSDVVGVGSEVPSEADLESYRGRRALADRYAIFIGRVDENKGCRQLFHFFRRYRQDTGSRLRLLLVGGRNMPIVDDPAIHYAGFLSEEDKWTALLGADLLIMPSELESLSMVTLEAWAAGKPVLANANCEVLRGQCRRSNAGLYFKDYYEFREALALLERDRSLREGLGRNGRRFFHAHYRWDVIEAKYDRILRRLQEQDEKVPAHASHAKRHSFWKRLLGHSEAS